METFNYHQYTGPQYGIRSENETQEMSIIRQASRTFSKLTMNPITRIRISVNGEMHDKRMKHSIIETGIKGHHHGRMLVQIQLVNRIQAGMCSRQYDLHSVFVYLFY